MMEKKLKTFAEDDEGTVTVDWIVLTAAMVGMGVYGIGAVQQGVNNLVSAIETGVSTTAVD